MAFIDESPGNVSFTSKAYYKICIQGYLDPSWSDRLGGMIISSGHSAGDKPLTFLEGGITDQAELIGILYSLYEMHLPLRSVSLLKVF